MDSSQPDLDSISNSISDLTCSSLEDFVREPLPFEPTHEKGRKIRYCSIENCSYNTSVITNLRRHLLNKHNIEISPKQPIARVQGYQNLQEIWSNSEDCMKDTIQNTVFSAHLKKDIVRKALVRFIVQQRLALSIVERPAFHTFVRALNPLADEHIIPTSHNTIRTAILSDWYEEKLILQRDLSHAISKINISLDIWTSPNRILFLGIVGYFVRPNSYYLQKNLLGLRQIGGHSGEEQFTVLRTILEEYDISDKLGVIIGDNASTNDTLCRTIAKWYHDNQERAWDAETQRIRCLGHIINLIVQAFLFSGSSSSYSLKDLEKADQQEQDGILFDVVQQKEIRKIGPLGKLHNIVVHIRSSAPRTKEFTTGAHKMIPLDNRTRWNSWYMMISAAIRLEKEVDFYTKNQPDLKSDTLEQGDWELLRTMADFLKTFKDITLENEGDKKSLSASLPSLFILKWHIRMFLEKNRSRTQKVCIYISYDILY
jgi:hypothetical protein